jgi:N-acetylmuramoyl-L-alanine amidase
MYIINKIKLQFAFFLTLVSFLTFGQSNTFKVVLDAGHGAQDSGAHYNGHIEKNIALSITLKVGKILEEIPSFKVIYTRKTDVFVTLKDRANIANKANADLFICIHCNANRNSNVSGSETYVMGMTRANMNFEVAKTENSVIFLEDNYKQSYKGFDPNVPETMLGLKIVQENNLESSIGLATKVQENFINNGIESRGVKQEPLWVLDASVMPGVLIETGFVSNPDEGNVLESEDGQNDRARAIANAIINYKNEYFGNEGNESDAERPSQKIIEKPVKDTSSPAKSKPNLEVATPKKTTNNQDTTGIIFKVQLSASSKKLELTPSNFKGLKDISIESGTNLYKYMYGETADYNDAKKLLQEAKSKGYDSAYLIAFKNGEKISVQDAIK